MTEKGYALQKINLAKIQKKQTDCNIEIWIGKPKKTELW
jgi:hypothetical protein